ncbi:FAD-dependent oxidoreductase [Caulobacter sp. 73W]|uniref:FAD-dependent oxidoreductase n=1 Tax=Caulobacter sp. 73W TaxID=3161137 RepID=A0AB39KSG2_9CAUL
MSATRALKTRCVVVGGGPAGMVASLLLARAGVETVVLEKHGDFLRDFRGDTIHPSTLQVMADLGVLEEFLRLPHQKVVELSGEFGNERFRVADFGHLPTAAKFLAIMPQWDFLNFLAEQAQRYPEFGVRMKTRAVGLIERDGKVVGVEAQDAEGPLTITADLIIAADGRDSVIRDLSGLPKRDLGAPMDVLWMRLPREEADGDTPLGRFDAGRIFVMIPRGEYYQCGYVIPKGGSDQVRAAGLPALQAQIAKLSPILAGRVGVLDDWEKVKTLTVTVDRLERWWRPGLLCIGDSAHAMSPVGGVGVNLAIQDAVAAANILSGPLRQGRLLDADLAAVERRRAWQVKLTQAI